MLPLWHPCYLWRSRWLKWGEWVQFNWSYVHKKLKDLTLIVTVLANIRINSVKEFNYPPWISATLMKNKNKQKNSIHNLFLVITKVNFIRYKLTKTIIFNFNSFNFDIALSLNYCKGHWNWYEVNKHTPNSYCKIWHWSHLDLEYSENCNVQFSLRGVSPGQKAGLTMNYSFLCNSKKKRKM